MLCPHGANLGGGGLGAEHHLLGDVEAILLVHRRVVGRIVESGPVEGVPLDLGALDGGVAHADEDVEDVLEGGHEGMAVADFGTASGECDVDRIGCAAGGLLCGELLPAALDRRFDELAGAVCLLARLGAQVSGELADAAEQEGKLPLSAEVGDPDLVERLRSCGPRNRCSRFLCQFADIIEREFSHVVSSRDDAFRSRSTNGKSPRLRRGRKPCAPAVPPVLAVTLPHAGPLWVPVTGDGPSLPSGPTDPRRGGTFRARLQGELRRAVSAGPFQPSRPPLCRTAARLLLPFTAFGDVDLGDRTTVRAVDARGRKSTRSCFITSSGGDETA